MKPKALYRGASSCTYVKNIVFMLMMQEGHLLANLTFGANDEFRNLQLLRTHAGRLPAT